MTTSGNRRGLAGALAALVVVGVVFAVAYGVSIGWGWQEMVDNFLVTNGLMALTFGLCGAVIAWHRPSNAIGWLFLADGIGHAITPVADALAYVVHGQVAQQVLVTISLAAWPWSIGLFLPLALLLFPDGRLLSPRWRWAAIGIIATSPLFVLEMTGSGEPVSPDLPYGYLTLRNFDALQPLWTATEVRNLVAILLALSCLGIRYRRADEAGRRQLLWLLLASVIALLFVIPWSFVAGTPILVLLAIPLIPIAIAVAIVRHQLLDIRLVVSRALTWALLSLVAIGIYAALVALLDSLIASQVGRSAAVTVFVALIIAPVLPRLQQLVDRALYGDRHDPARVASRVGSQLSSGLPGVVAAIRAALRLPYAALRVDGATIAADGTLPTRPHPGTDGTNTTATGPTALAAADAGVARAETIGVAVDGVGAGGVREGVFVVPLVYGGEVVGALEVGVRSGESALSAADRSVLGLVAVPLAVAVHATRLSAELQASREKLVSAREEERRRLRRDLHDGLGPTLTGVAFSADAAANLITTDTSQALPAGAARAVELLARLRSDTRTAIADVRQLVEDLRPPALDELGLVGALRQRVDQLSFRADGATIRVEVAADGLPALPAALEVAAYRIATEALTNVVRHSSATSAVLTLRCENDLEIEVADDGPPTDPWHPGVGLQAMRERAAELGGTFQAGPTPTGGHVRARFPLPTRPPTTPTSQTNPTTPTGQATPTSTLTAAPPSTPNSASPADPTSTPPSAPGANPPADLPADPPVVPAVTSLQRATPADGELAAVEPDPPADLPTDPPTDISATNVQRGTPAAGELGAVEQDPLEDQDVDGCSAGVRVVDESSLEVR
ncbi:histidine kinase [Kribbella sp. NPDC048928]|uniref:sensor histidine kinase n=1 Tax=Kribbella sp. NPDC048928 TaxID=3364111 RepID=UPI00371F6E8A